MIAENPQVREDLISTLAEFCRRHGIDAGPDDFVGLGGGAQDTGGHLAGTGTGIVVDSPQIFIYRDGPRRSRWVWSG